MKEISNILFAAKPGPTYNDYQNNYIEQNFPMDFNQMYYQEEVLPKIIKVTSVNDNIYIMDKRFINDPNFICQFQISHLINATTEKYECEIEGIHLKVLNIAWEDSPNQILLDDQDSIPISIENFIDECIEKGENVLVYSVKGQNRACIIVLLYLLRKYNWTIRKCLEFLKHLKSDVSIPQYFLNQLVDYEEKLKKQNPERSDKWFGVHFKDSYEELLTNTFINDCFVKTMPLKLRNVLDRTKKHVIWGDNNPYDAQTGLIVYNSENDLYLKKNIEDVICHRDSIPLKSCIKKNKNSVKNLIRHTNSVSYLINDANENNLQAFDRKISVDNYNQVSSFSRILHKNLLMYNNNHTLNNENHILKNGDDSPKYSTNSEIMRPLAHKILNKSINNNQEIQINFQSSLFRHSPSADKVNNNNSINIVISPNNTPELNSRSMNNVTNLRRIHSSNRVLSIQKYLENISRNKDFKIHYNTGTYNEMDNNLIISQNNLIPYNNYTNTEKEKSDLIRAFVDPDNNPIFDRYYKSKTIKRKNPIQANIVLNQNYYITQNNNIFTPINNTNLQINQTASEMSQTITKPKIPELSNKTKKTSVLQVASNTKISKPMKVPKIQNQSGIYKIIQNAGSAKKPQILKEPKDSERLNRAERIKNQKTLNTKPQSIPIKKSPKILESIQICQAQNLSQKLKLLNLSKQIPLSQTDQIEQYLIPGNNYSDLVNDYTNSSPVIDNFKTINNNIISKKNAIGRQTWTVSNSKIVNNLFDNHDASEMSIYNDDSNQLSYFKPYENSIVYNLIPQKYNENEIQLPNYKNTIFQNNFYDTPPMRAARHKNKIIDYSNDPVANNLLKLYGSSKISNLNTNNQFEIDYNKIILDKNKGRRRSVQPPPRTSFTGYYSPNPSHNIQKVNITLKKYSLF